MIFSMFCIKVCEEFVVATIDRHLKVSRGFSASKIFSYKLNFSVPFAMAGLSRSSGEIFT